MFRDGRTRLSLSRISPATLERLAIGAILFLGAWQAWVYKFKPYSDDAVSYLDLSDSVLAGHLSGVVNGHWSPAYPVLAAIVRLVARPSRAWEFASLKLVNFGLLVFAVLSFRYFLRAFIKWQQRDADGTGVGPSEKQWTIIGFSLFGWVALYGVQVIANTPDLGVLGFVFLALGIVVSLRLDAGPQLASFAGLGVVLGLGYLCKTILLPLAIVILPLAWLSPRGLKHGLLAGVVSVTAMVAVAGPFVFVLSRQMQMFTIGESGRNNYIWYVEPQLPDHNWAGPTSDGRMPTHPMRQISTTPAAFEFDAPIGGTYPGWTDPAYWYVGIKPRFAPERLLTRLVNSSVAYWQQFGLVMIGGWLVLVVVSGGIHATLRRLTRSEVLLVPALAGLSMYGCIYDFPGRFEMRYIAPFVVLLPLALLATVRMPASWGQRVFRGVAVVAILVFAQAVADRARDDVRILTQTGNEPWAVAEGLRAAGLRAGDRVAHLGDRGYYWARLLRVTIVAEIPDADQWWAQSDEVRSALIQRLRQAGIRAIVQRPGLPMPAGHAEWQHLPGDAYLLILS
jgi:hypothetical protein